MLRAFWGPRRPRIRGLKRGAGTAKLAVKLIPGAANTKGVSPMNRRFSVSSLLLLTFGTTTLPAQGDRGSIAGVVSDSSGGVVPGVTIEAVNPATNLKAETVTTSTGVYRLLSLPIGRYTVTATMPGFQTYIRQDAQVQVNQT